jgi:hypothetical protein
LVVILSLSKEDERSPFDELRDDIAIIVTSC